MKYKLLTENFNKLAAYWISPKGKVIEVDQTHINKIISNPEEFDLTKEFIDEKFKEYGDRIGQEGKAREDIIIGLVKQGWIRIRNYLKQGYWSINVISLTDRAMGYLQDWADHMIKLGASKYNEVRIDTRTELKTPSLTMEDLSQDELYKLVTEKKTDCIIITKELLLNEEIIVRKKYNNK